MRSVPRPPAIAYDERAEGTTAVDVSVDDRGIPVKCTIAKSSGWMVLDVAVCRAVMHARYSPRTMNGRPVDGIYHDAFTFRSNDGDGDVDRTRTAVRSAFARDPLTGPAAASAKSCAA